MNTLWTRREHHFGTDILIETSVDDTFDYSDMDFDSDDVQKAIDDYKEGAPYVHT